MMNIRSLNRWQAFLSHFGISLIIFIALLLTIVFVWYPGAFIHLGGWQGIQIVAAVDLVLGPVLTLLVFNPTKKSLKFDLSIIVAIQLSCLGYGVWTIEQQRPLTQAILDDRLYVIPKAQYKAENVEIDFLDAIPGPSPKMVMLDLPNDHSFIARQVVTNLFTGTATHLQTNKYIPITTAAENPTHNEKLEWLLNRLDFDKERNCYWLAAESSYYKGELCFNPEKGAIDQRSLTENKNAKDEKTSDATLAAKTASPAKTAAQ